MQNKHVNTLAAALRSVSIHDLNDTDGYAIINNIIALTDKGESLEKTHKEALEKYKPKDYDKLEGEKKREATEEINEKFSKYIEPILDKESGITLETISQDSIDKIIKQKEVTTTSKAMILKFLKKI